MRRILPSFVILFSVACLPARPAPEKARLGYIAVAESGKIVAVDFQDWKVVKEYSGFATPHGAVVTPDGEEIYVASFEVDYLTVVNAKSGVTRKIEMGGKTHHMRTSPDGDVIYVTLGNQSAMAFVERYTDKILAKAPCGEAPFDLMLSPDGASVFVANTASGDVTKVDAQTYEALGTLKTGEGTTHVVVTSDSATVYVTNAFAGTVSEIDSGPLKKLRDFEVGEDAHGVALSPDESKVYVSGWEKRIVEIARDTGKTRDIEVPSNDTHGIWYTPDKEHLLICDIVDNRMVALDPGTLAEQQVVSLPPSPHQISFPDW